MILTLVYIFSNTEGKSQIFKLREIETLSIYDIDAFGKKDDIEKKTVVTFDKNLTRKFFEEVKFHEGSMLWKGSFLGIGKLSDGNEVNLAISYYGGFFKIKDKSGYYEFVGKSKLLFENEIRKVIENQFIPNRPNKN